MSDIDSDSNTVQPYDSAVETKVSGLAGTMLGGKKRRRRTRGKRHTLKKARKVKSRKLRSRRAKRRRGKRSRRSRKGRGFEEGNTNLNIIISTWREGKQETFQLPNDGTLSIESNGNVNLVTINNDTDYKPSNINELTKFLINRLSPNWLHRQYQSGGKGCTSGTSSFAVAGNTLGASESMLANPPPVSLN